MYEYKFAFIGSSYFHSNKEKVLSHWGDDGWEFTGHTEKDSSGRYYLMKRLKTTDDVVSDKPMGENAEGEPETLDDKIRRIVVEEIAASDRLKIRMRDYGRAPSSRLLKSQRVTLDLDEAKQVLHKLKELVIKYNYISVEDYYDVLGVSSVYGDSLFGWTDLDRVQVVWKSGGWALDLPEPKRLNR